VHDVSFALEQGQIGCLLGPSGSGKTTLLRAIAGFQDVNQGTISVRGEVMSSADIMVPAEKRCIGMMFQDLALFPHLSVADNIAFGISNLSRKEARARVDELLDIVNMKSLKSKYPHELSGGQQQRVALIRAMAPRPDLMLLDEPFSSQDTELRVQLVQEVREILKEDNVTAILVTHDQHEAFAIADGIGVLNEGRLSQWDTAYNLYHTPSDRFVADFVGEGVLICGNIIDGKTVQTELGDVNGELAFDLPRGMEVDLLVRPDDIIHDDYSTYRGTVLKKSFRGADHLYTLRMPGGTNVMCLAPSHHDHKLGENIGVRLRIDHLVAFPKTSIRPPAQPEKLALSKTRISQP
jgi:iron(III) transport system ATP-binding protein